MDDVGYTDNGDKCMDKCQWDQNTNTTIQFMKCLDVYGAMSPCTPFTSKVCDNLG